MPHATGGEGTESIVTVAIDDLHRPKTSACFPQRGESGVAVWMACESGGDVFIIKYHLLLSCGPRALTSQPLHANITCSGLQSISPKKKVQNEKPSKSLFAISKTNARLIASMLSCCPCRPAAPAPNPCLA